VEHVDQLGFVRGRHHHEVRDRPQEREVEDAVMCRTVLTHETRPIQTEDHVQTLKSGVHDHLVVGALDEGRVDGDDRNQAAASESRCQTHRVLLGYPDVEEAVGETARRTL